MDAYNHLRINNLKWVFENENRFYQKLFKHCLNIVNFSSEMKQKLQYTCTVV